MTDIRRESTRWPEFSASTTRLSMADVATSYVVNASKLRQQEQLSEQAKGIIAVGLQV